MASETILRWLESWGHFNLTAACALAVAVLVAAMAPFPRSLLAFGAGAAFGLPCLLIIIPVTTIGSIAAFLLSRNLCRGWVSRQIDKRATWRAIARAVDEEGWRIIALMRFAGPLPNSAQNYLFGLTGIGLLPYALITFVCTLPQVVLYVFLGKSSRSILLEDGLNAYNGYLLPLAAITVLAIVTLVTVRARAILNERAIEPG